MRKADAHGTAGHADDRRKSAQGAAVGRRLADHIQADAAEEVQGRRRPRRRRRRLHQRRLQRQRRPGGLVVGQGRPERAPARVRRTGGRRVRHEHRRHGAVAAADVPVVRAAHARLSRGRLGPRRRRSAVIARLHGASRASSPADGFRPCTSVTG